jgi:hypothetical protein
MTAREMQEYVEIELRQRDPNYEVKSKLESKELFYFLSRAERDYVQEIYDDGIDKNEENRKKLGALLVSGIISSGDITQNTYYEKTGFNSAYDVVMPDGILYTINERARFVYGGLTYDNIFVKPISFDEYSVNKENPFRRDNIEKCLRLESANRHTILLLYGGALNRIYLDYITTPTGIFVSDDTSGDCQLHESVHYNIVRNAVKLILAAKQEQVGYNIQSIEGKQNN